MGKSTRRVQANARTLSYAVRQYFRPALREIQPAASTSNSLQEASLSATGAAFASTQPAFSPASSSPTPEDQLIPTQPEEPAVQQSEKSSGKRKRVESTIDTTAGADQQGVQTRFTQANIPPALKKCESLVLYQCSNTPYAETLK